MKARMPKQLHLEFFSLPSFEQSILIVDHILGCCTELLVSFDNFVYCIKEIFLRHCLSPCSYGIHPCLCADTSYISSCKTACQKINELHNNEAQRSQKYNNTTITCKNGSYIYELRKISHQQNLGKVEPEVQSEYLARSSLYGYGS